MKILYFGERNIFISVGGKSSANVDAVISPLRSSLALRALEEA